MNLSIESPAFSANTMIPKDYTCEGSDLSPPLIWTNSFDNTKSYVLIMDDPDAPNGTWDHWVLLNIPATVTQLSAGEQIPSGTISGKNSWGTSGYRGPCPPSGIHHYHFKLYALDSLINIDGVPNKNEVIAAMEGHIIANVELIGLYQKFNN